MLSPFNGSDGESRGEKVQTKYVRIHYTYISISNKINQFSAPITNQISKYVYLAKSLKASKTTNTYTYVYAAA
jgi:hypothetical protein